ncbi:MAG: hypothetical protein Q8S31_05960 [Alphaproteobacteria bacterium]|nr:hypothetical protein [Alphaproteobacteria bacterium]
MKKLTFISLLAFISLEFKANAWVDTQKFETSFINHFNNSVEQLDATLQKLIFERQKQLEGKSTIESNIFAEAKYLPDTMTRINKLSQFQIRNQRDLITATTLALSLERFFKLELEIDQAIIDDSIRVPLKDLLSYILNTIFDSPFYSISDLISQFQILEIGYNAQILTGINGFDLLSKYSSLLTLACDNESNLVGDIFIKMEELNASALIQSDESQSYNSLTLPEYTSSSSSSAISASLTPKLHKSVEISLSKLKTALANFNYEEFIKIAYELNEVLKENVDQKKLILTTFIEIFNNFIDKNLVNNLSWNEEKTLIIIALNDHFGSRINEFGLLRKEIYEKSFSSIGGTDLSTVTETSDTSSSSSSSEVKSSSSDDDVMAETLICLGHLLKENNFDQSKVDTMTKGDIVNFFKNATIPKKIAADFNALTENQKVKAFCEMFCLDL